MSLQVINKYGDLYGAERIAELLGLDKSALDFNPTEETVMKDASLLSWSGTPSLILHQTPCYLFWGFDDLLFNSLFALQVELHRHQVSRVEAGRGLHR